MLINAQVQAYGNPETFFKRLVGVEVAAGLIRITPERLLDLASAGMAPCVRIDGGAPLFIKTDVLAWARDELTKIQSGTNLSEPMIVRAVVDGTPKTSDIPDSLLPMADRLYEFGHFGISAVYFLIKNKEVVYVGQSVGLAARLQSHFGFKDFDRVFYIKIPRHELNETEGAFIRALKPKLNIGAHGRLTAPMVNDVTGVLERNGFVG